MTRILVDTGPLVAILLPQDEHHNACIAAFEEMSATLLTCWPVLTEAAWLLRSSPRSVQSLLNSINIGFLEVLPLAGEKRKPLPRS